ncbi:MAG: DUF5666 domain-containing protein [Acidobacteriota bacterium]
MQRMARFILLIVFLTPTLLAQEVEQQPLAQGIVSSVDVAHNLISIAGGQVVIDATGAQFRNDAGDTTIAAVRPGAHIATVILPGVYTASTPLKASVVQILIEPIGSLTGPVEAIDLTAGTFTVLGHAIRVDERTRIGGEIPSRDPHALAELAVGMSVHVRLNGSQDELVAVEVFVHSPRPDTILRFVGKVLSIQGNVWTIQGAQVMTVYTTSHTSIDPLALVGNTVSVLARVDGGQLTAIDIALYVTPRVIPPQLTQTIIGILRARDAESITVNNGPATTRIFLAPYTRFIDDPQIGDNVRVIVQREGERILAISVEKYTGTVVFTFIDTVLEINVRTWRIGEYEVFVNDATAIQGAPVVGDRVRVLGERQQTGVILARTIIKL